MSYTQKRKHEIMETGWEEEFHPELERNEKEGNDEWKITKMYYINIGNGQITNKKE